MKATILGSGTSSGVPRIGGVWGDCDPTEPKNRRRRVSLHVAWQGLSLLVDTSPDLREQCLDAGIDRLDGVLYTHDHADHTHGIDDLRAFTLLQRREVPVYAEPRVIETLHRRFGYVFEGGRGYPPICVARAITGPIRFGPVTVLPYRQQHGDIHSLGFRFGPLAYSTDVSGLPEAAFEALAGVKVWIVDALRYRSHPTHAHLDLTLEWIRRVQPERAILTHMTWEMDYATLLRELPPGVEPAYDGLTIELPDATD